MKEKMVNEVEIEGLVYESKLKIKVTGEKSKKPGTEFISGELLIATDSECLNIIPIHYTYVTAVTASGNANSTYATLKNIADGKIASVMSDGRDKAAKVRINTSIALNDFYTDRSGTEELVSAKRNEGGFIHVVDVLSNNEDKSNFFKCDMVITRVIVKEPDEEKDLPEKAIIKGAIFDFRKSLLPVEFSAVNPGAIQYFESLDASDKNPVFTQVWGRQISETVVRKIEEESAFGEAFVREVKSTRKDWVITGALKETYLWDDPSTITVSDLTEAMANRETYLATLKQKNDEYKASKAATITAIPSGTFNF